MSGFVWLTIFSFLVMGSRIEPASVQAIEHTGHYTLNANTPINHNSESAEEVQYLAKVLAPAMDAPQAVESVVLATFLIFGSSLT